MPGFRDALRAPLQIAFGHEQPLCNKGQRVATTENIELLEAPFNKSFK
jgi:hypothetical protein